MNTLGDIITYIRRIIKSPSNATISDNLIIDYINRFWIMDVDARMQLFDFKTAYQFTTTPGVASYNMPMYQVQVEPGPQNIASYPVYQGFFDQCKVNGINVTLSTQREVFWNLYPNYLQALPAVVIADGTSRRYQLNLPFFPAIPGYMDSIGMIAAGITTTPFFTPTFITTIPVTSVIPGVYISYTTANGGTSQITDSGQFLSNATDGNLYGLLMPTVPAGVLTTDSLGSFSMTDNTVNYNTGVINVTFPTPPPPGTPIQVQCFFYEQGIPRAILYYNNVITIRPPPNTQYIVELGAYLTPAALLQSGQGIQFAYMAEYLARGSARKILSDTGDVEQFMFYEPLFREQENLVWKRSQRQFTATRTQTLFSDTGTQTTAASANVGLN